MLDIKCPSCERHLQLPEDAVERECQCPACGTLFAPARNRRHPEGHAAAGEEQITAALPKPRPSEDENKDADGLDHQVGYPDELDDENADRAIPYPWHEGKLAAKIGFGIGCIAGILALLLGRDFDLLSSLWQVLSIGFIGAMDGYIIVVLSHWRGPRDQPWLQKSLLGLLAIWLAGCLYVDGSLKGPKSIASVYFAGILGFVIVLLGWLLLVTITLLVRIRKKR